MVWNTPFSFLPMESAVEAIATLISAMMRKYSSDAPVLRRRPCGREGNLWDAHTHCPFPLLLSI
jgi:hypothetical protein